MTCSCCLCWVTSEIDVLARRIWQYFLQLVGAGQEYCGHIFSQPICVIMASNKELEASVHAVLEGTTIGMYSQSTRGPELVFYQVKFVKFLKVGENSTILQCLQHENKSACQKKQLIWSNFYFFPIYVLLSIAFDQASQLAPNFYFNIAYQQVISMISFRQCMAVICVNSVLENLVTHLFISFFSFETWFPFKKKLCNDLSWEGMEGGGGWSSGNDYFLKIPFYLVSRCQHI